MSPTTKHYVLIVLQALFAAVTVLHAQLGGEWAVYAGTAASLLNGAVMLLTASPMLTLAQKAAAVRVAGSMMAIGAFAALTFGCLPNGQPTPQTAADIQAAEADLKTALPVACVIGEAIDPALLTAICAVADAADNLLTAPAVVVTATPAQAAALVVAHPASAAVAAKLVAAPGLADLALTAKLKANRTAMAKAVH